MSDKTKKTYPQEVYSTQAGELASWIKAGKAPKTAPTVLYSISTEFQGLLDHLTGDLNASVMTDYLTASTQLDSVTESIDKLSLKMTKFTMVQRTLTQSQYFNSLHKELDGLMLDKKSLEDDKDFYALDLLRILKKAMRTAGDFKESVSNVK